MSCKLIDTTPSGTCWSIKVCGISAPVLHYFVCMGIKFMGGLYIDTVRMIAMITAY
jgi:hypothetical protein